MKRNKKKKEKKRLVTIEKRFEEARMHLRRECSLGLPTKLHVV